MCNLTYAWLAEGLEPEDRRKLDAELAADGGDDLWRAMMRWPGEEG